MRFLFMDLRYWEDEYMRETQNGKIKIPYFKIGFMAFNQYYLPCNSDHMGKWEIISSLFLKFSGFICIKKILFYGT